MRSPWLATHAIRLAPLALALFLPGCSREPQRPADSQLAGTGSNTVEPKQPVAPGPAGPSNEQIQAAEEDLRIATEKMEQLVADVPKIERKTLQQMVTGDLARIKDQYHSMSQTSGPGYAEKWYRQKLEGKTIYDFAGPSSRPDNIAAHKALNADRIRFYEAIVKEKDAARKNHYTAARNKLSAEGYKRFPEDEVASINWFLDQVRDKSPEELPAVLKASGVVAESAVVDQTLRPAPDAKQIDLAEAIATIQANEAKVKNAQWHVVFSTGSLERDGDASSYKSLPLSRIEGNALYDYETDHFRVELSGASEWSKEVKSPPTPLAEWRRVCRYDGTAMCVLQINGSNSPQAIITRDAASHEGRHEILIGMTTQAGGIYFLNSAPYSVANLPLPRLSKQLEMKNQSQPLQVNLRDNNGWLITDSATGSGLAYDPSKGAILGAQFLSPPGPAAAGNAAAATGFLKIELQQVGEFWPPKTVTHANYLAADPVRQFEFSDVKINQTLSPDDFKIELPPQTHVIDRVTKKSHMSGPTKTSY